MHEEIEVPRAAKSVSLLRRAERLLRIYYSFQDAQKLSVAYWEKEGPHFSRDFVEAYKNQAQFHHLIYYFCALAEMFPAELVWLKSKGDHKIKYVKRLSMVQRSENDRQLLQEFFLQHRGTIMEAAEQRMQELGLFTVK